MGNNVIMHDITVCFSHCEKYEQNQSTVENFDTKDLFNWQHRVVISALQGMCLGQQANKTLPINTC